MDPTRFDAKQREHLVRTPEGAWAFVPPPLPPPLNFGDLAMALTAAATALGELKGAARRLPNPYMLVGSLQRREALTSSAMEGTITTLGDMMLEEAGGDSSKSDDARETFNYVRALEQSTEMIKTLPISNRVIKAAHETLLRGLSPARGAGKRPGEYKVHQKAVGKFGETVHTARYVPPPPNETLDCMGHLERYINREDRKPAEALVDLGLAHYQFEAIHPFADGNGRIGRMLITLMAMQFGLIDLPLLHLSARLEHNKDEYVDRLFAVSTKAKWNDWLAFFLTSVEQSSMDATAIIDRILGLQTELKARALQAKKSPRLPMIIESLFMKSWTTVSEIQELCKVSFPTAQSDLKTLVSQGILHERQARRGKTIYFAPEILALSDRR